jgi:hypothetical protein
MISAFGNTWALVSFTHRPEMWSGWKCEITTVETEAGSSPASRRAVVSKSRIEQHDLAAGLDRGDRERVVELVRADAAGDERLLHVVERGVLDEVGVEHPLDGAVMQAEDLDIADLVFEAVGGALRMRRVDERNGSLETENERSPRAPEDQIAT